MPFLCPDTMLVDSQTSLNERATSGLHESLISRIPAPIQPDDPILDIACGTGAWLARLRERGFVALTGIDFDIQQTQFAGARILQADLNEAPWPVSAATYKLITAIELVEHIENFGVFFAQISRLLAADGVVMMTTPNIESLAARLRFLLLNELKQFDSIGDPTHLFPVVTATLPRILARHGLKIVTRWGYPYGGTTRSSRLSVNALTRALRLILREPVPGDNLCLILQKA
jgi:2-polyprenyl-3-methyl-5-hydroxy-6-metoxy-1,4-benzoquinol methylase